MTTKSITKNKKKTAAKSGLSGYLVVWRHTMDDIPVGLYATEADAIKAAKTMTWRQGYAAARRMNMDCTTPVCFAYATFENGAATAFTIVDRKDDA